MARLTTGACFWQGRLGSARKYFESNGNIGSNEDPMDMDYDGVTYHHRTALGLGGRKSGDACASVRVRGSV